MTLTESEAEHFYQLWFPLLDYVNRKYQVCPEIETIDPGQGIDSGKAKAIADYLWSHTEIIDEYLSAAELTSEDSYILASWKQCRPGRYILERHLKKGSVFISVEDESVYMVKGLFSTWEEMLGKAPLLLNAALLPFQGGIVSDGLVVAYPVRFSKRVAEGFKDVYMNAKRNGSIRYSLLDE